MACTEQATGAKAGANLRYHHEGHEEHEGRFSRKGAKAQSKLFFEFSELGVLRGYARGIFFRFRKPKPNEKFKYLWLGLVPRL